MSFTSGQYNQFKKHPNIDWLEKRAQRNELVHQDTIKSKISEAIRFAFPDRITDENIRWVAQQVGMPWGDVYTAPAAAEGEVNSEAAAEIRGTDPGMAQAVRMVFNRTARGRTAPGTSGVNHIHVGGNAELNLLFDIVTYTILGVVNGHMDSGMSPTVKSQAGRVMARRGGTTLTLTLRGTTIT
jgi:hypothetical protein